MEIFYPASGAPDPKAVAQLENCMNDPRAVAGALMADHHLGYSMPIGGVIGYLDAISPSGVGFDIACGNKAVQTNLRATEIELALPEIMDRVYTEISFGMGRVNPTPVDHPVFEKHADTLEWLGQQGRKGGAPLSQKARAQLGTVGSGNHYIDLLYDLNGALWVANHFGSRGLGHTIATGFLNLAAGRDFGARAPEAEEPTVLDVGSELGQRYLAAMELAGDYAYAGRDLVIDQVLGILGARAVGAIHNHHNYAWLEDGLWIVRKGATPLTSELAYIGGSMGEGAVIVRGRPDTALGDLETGVKEIGALGSAPHGAGRVMSRTRAAGKVKRTKVYECSNRDCDFQVAARDFKPGVTRCPTHGEDHRFVRRSVVRHTSEGVVDWQAVQAGLRARGIELRGAGADEAPEVYKPLEEVIAAHPNIEVVNVLRPLAVAMAGPDVFDPYKD